MAQLQNLFQRLEKTHIVREQSLRFHSNCGTFS
jgi:hypothetical protein